jgi:hypothetical protein
VFIKSISDKAKLCGVAGWQNVIPATCSSTNRQDFPEFMNSILVETENSPSVNGMADPAKKARSSLLFRGHGNATINRAAHADA